MTVAATGRDDETGSESAEAQDPSPVERAPGQTKPNGKDFTNILDGIPKAWERAQESIDEAKRGKTMPLSEL